VNTQLERGLIMLHSKSGKGLGESGRIGYAVLYFMGVPIGILLILWALLGDNLIGRG
jgi:hypothetical protein